MVTMKGVALTHTEKVPMEILHENPRRARYSARDMVKPINFYCDAPNAQAVYLVGDLNRWNSATHPMERRVDGWWFLQVRLTHGHHRSRFLVDGKPTLDPNATGFARDDCNEEVSLVAVS